MPKNRSITQKDKSVSAGTGRTNVRASGKRSVTKTKDEKSTAAKLSKKENNTASALKTERASAHDQSRLVDFALFDRLVAEITKKRTEGYNIVERCGALQLPLVLDGEESLNKAFHAALAELEICYSDPGNQKHQTDLRLVLESVYGRTTIDNEFRIPDPDPDPDQACKLY